jgi:hypothetical protein
MGFTSFRSAHPAGWKGNPPRGREAHHLEPKPPHPGRRNHHSHTTCAGPAEPPRGPGNPTRYHGWNGSPPEPSSSKKSGLFPTPGRASSQGDDPAGNGQPTAVPPKKLSHTRNGPTQKTYPLERLSTTQSSPGWGSSFLLTRLNPSPALGRAPYFPDVSRKFPGTIPVSFPGSTTYPKGSHKVLQDLVGSRASRKKVGGSYAASIYDSRAASRPRSPRSRRVGCSRIFKCSGRALPAPWSPFHLG